ncbi:MAG: VWA domain-containing protein [Candidatus Eremiobacteraeota bacterium]|nr:VWA domain-containing protein [Candidatus Eremiobacteraeota bacterium]
MLKLSYELSHRLVSDAAASRLYVLVKMSAPAVEREERKALNLGVALDRSGSMSGAKLDSTKHSSKFLISQLSGDDIISVVIFDHSVEVVIPAQKVANKDHMKGRIDQVAVGGNTNLSGGWLAAASEVLKNYSKEKVNRVILLTDGQANEGIKEAPELIAIAEDLGKKGVSTTSIGFGGDFNEDLLRGIAEGGRGNFYFIDTPEKAPRTFAEELTGLLDLFAQNLVLTITPSKQVEYVGIHQDLNVTGDQKGIEISLGDLYAGDEKNVLVEFITPASRAGSEAGISVLKLGYQQVYGKVAFKEVSAFVKVGYGHHDEVAAQTINPIVNRELLICDSIRARKDAVNDADKGDLEKARKKLESSIDNLKKSSFSEDESFREEVKKMESLLGHYGSIEAYRSIGRKQSVFQSYYSSMGKGSVSLSRLKVVPWEVAERLKNAKDAVIVTGGLLQAEYGVPLIREMTYEKEGNTLYLFTSGTFIENEALIWNAIGEKQGEIKALKSFPVYNLLARLESFWRICTVVTENIDGMHLIAGNKNVLELNGSIFRQRCTGEGHRVEQSPPGAGLCTCGSPLRPDIVWLDEEMPDGVKAGLEKRLSQAEVIILVGTALHSLLEPLKKARERDALVIDINNAKTDLTGEANVALTGTIGELFALLWLQIMK